MSVNGNPSWRSYQGQRSRSNLHIFTICSQNGLKFQHLTLTLDLEMTLSINSHTLTKRYCWYLTTDEIRLKDEIIRTCRWKMLILDQKWWKFQNVTLTFDLEITLRVIFHQLAIRYPWYVTTDVIWLECDEIIRFSGWKNAHSRPKIVKILKFDLDLWPWNDSEGDFSLIGNEISLICNHRWDKTEMWWNH